MSSALSSLHASMPAAAVAALDCDDSSEAGVFSSPHPASGAAAASTTRAKVALLAAMRDHGNRRSDVCGGFSPLAVHRD